jgi:hypothetical protein
MSGSKPRLLFSRVCSGAVVISYGWSQKEELGANGEATGSAGY